MDVGTVFTGIILGGEVAVDVRNFIKGINLGG